MKTLGVCLVIFGACLFSAGSRADDEGRNVGITRIDITQTTPVPGTYGEPPIAYELLNGVAYGELDPSAPENSGIVNIQRAPRNARRHVEYHVEIAIMQPSVPGTGNHKLIYSVVNRGNGVPAPGTSPDPQDSGTGFWMSQHYTILWSGWQGELWEGNPATLKGHFPIATHGGQHIIGPNREEYIPDTGGNGGFPFTDRPTNFTGYLTYPTASLNPGSATLTVRERETDQRQVLPSSYLTFDDANNVTITKAQGFDQGAIYELVYMARDPIVNGIGFASTRDLVSFLRYGSGNDDSEGEHQRFRNAFGYGVSQSGRYLKDLVYQGFNRDVLHRQVFDGILPVIPGSRKTSLNVEFSEAGRFSRQHEDHTFPGDQFPFTYATTFDPISNRTDGVLVRCSRTHTCPKVVQVDSDSETFQARASLVVTDTNGDHLRLPNNVRVYMVAGAQHGGGTSQSAHTRGICKEFQDPIPMTPYLRALLVALDRWATHGRRPPASAYANLEDGSLVTIEEAQALYPRIPNSPYSIDALNRLNLVDHSHQPPVIGPPYPVYVTRPNADGNPVGGIVPPEISVPYATYSGRNLRAETHSPGEACNLSGSYIPFPATPTQGDDRTSIADRYPGGQDQYSQMRAAAVDELIRQGYVLEQDRASLSAGILGEP
jgi:hypothetical protein